MLTFQLEDLLLIVLVWLVCGMVSALLFVRFIVMRYAGKAVINAITNPDAETKGAVAALLNMILTVPIKTGKKVKDGDGREIDEVLPFSRFMMREMANFMLAKFKASMGGHATDAGDNVDEIVNSDMKLKLFSKMRPKKKNQSRVDWLLEMVAENPEILDKFKNVHKDTSSTLL